MTTVVVAAAGDADITPSRWVPEAVAGDPWLVLLYFVVLAIGAFFLVIACSVLSWLIWRRLTTVLFDSWFRALLTFGVTLLFLYLDYTGAVELAALYRDGFSALDAGPAEFWGVVIGVVYTALVITLALAVVWGLIRRPVVEPAT